jgi:hypothetical protein
MAPWLSVQSVSCSRVCATISTTSYCTDEIPPLPRSYLISPNSCLLSSTTYHNDLTQRHTNRRHRLLHTTSSRDCRRATGDTAFPLHISPITATPAILTAMAKRWIQVPANASGYRAPGWTNKVTNMPTRNISDWDSKHVYLIDDVVRGQGVVQGIGSTGAVQHERCCNLMYELCSNFLTGCTVHSLRMQAGDREEHFTQKIAVELEKYTARDLIIFYYHGKAGDKKDEYTW